MPLLNELYNKAESLKGIKLTIVVLAIVILFIPLGILLGYFINPSLNKNEVSQGVTSDSKDQNSKIYREGKIVYVNPKDYPLDNISYVLIDSKNAKLPLKSSDEKLRISEGLTVRVGGKLVKSKDGSFDLLVVQEVIINASN